MRVMVLVKADKDSEADKMPSTDLLAAMGAYNEKLVKAGIMQAGEGLHPTSKGVRVKFAGKERTVRKGPFTDSNDIVAGFWLWKVESVDEAIDWLKRAPFEGAEVEIRPIFEAEDFGVELTPELRAQEERLRAQVGGRG
jgi:hypothetical protein